MNTYERIENVQTNEIVSLVKELQIGFEFKKEGIVEIAESKDGVAVRVIIFIGIGRSWQRLPIDLKECGGSVEEVLQTLREEAAMQRYTEKLGRKYTAKI